MQNYDFVHSCIRVMDLGKSIEFYKDALNLKELIFCKLRLKDITFICSLISLSGLFY
jgi:hypothetical protein